jgi:hypothetical protein
MHRSRISGRRLLLCLAAWPLLGGAAAGATILGLRFGVRAWARAHAADVAAIALLEAYLALLVSLALCFGGPAGLAGQLGFRLRAGWHLALAPAGWLFAFVVGTLATLGVTRLTGQQPQSNAVDVLKISFDPLFVALIVPTVALLAPACEELLFRGAIFGWLRGRLPVAAAVAISAAVFAGAHLIPPLFPYLFVFGVTAALIYQYTGSTLVTFLMHAGQNTIAVAAAYYAIANGRV